MIITAFDKGKPINWASMLLDSFQLRCKKVKDGVDLFIAPMLYHLYKFEGRLTAAELQEYEEALANRSLADDPMSGDEATETEDDDSLEVLTKPEPNLSMKRVLRSRMETATVRAVMPREGVVVDQGEDTLSESKFRSAVDSFCKSSADNAKLIEILMQKLSCTKGDLIEAVDSMQDRQATLQQEQRKLEATMKDLERKLKESVQSSVLPGIQSSLSTLMKTTETISLSTVERLQLAALTSDGWKNEEKNLSKIATAITNQKGLLDKKYEAVAKLVGDLQELLTKHVEAIPDLQIGVDQSPKTVILESVIYTKEDLADFHKTTDHLEKFISHVVEFVEPSVDFLQYYSFKKRFLCYHHQIPEFGKRQGVSLNQIYQVWLGAAAEERELIAFALLYGDLKVEDLSLANRLLGNLPGWAVLFQCTYLENLDIHLSTLVAGDIEIDSTPADNLVQVKPLLIAKLESLSGTRKSLVLLESKAIMGTLKSRLEFFQSQSVPTIFDRIRQIGGESGFSLEKLERGIIAAARVQKLFNSGHKFVLEAEIRQFSCPTPMIDREYTFVSDMVEKNQLFDPLLVTPAYSPPRMNEMLQLLDQGSEPVSVTTKPVFKPYVGIDAISVDSDAAEDEDLSTEVTQVGTVASRSPLAHSGWQKRKRFKSNTLAANPQKHKRLPSVFIKRKTPKHKECEIK